MMEGGLLSWAYCNYTSRERKEELQKETDGRIWLQDGGRYSMKYEKEPKQPS